MKYQQNQQQNHQYNPSEYAKPSRLQWEKKRQQEQKRNNRKWGTL